jgi:precorrin-8X/cobalt-precorrin-8 methylmutase
MRSGASRTVHPIELRSLRILRSRVDTSKLGYWSRAVTERMIHASADIAYFADLVLSEAALVAAARALEDGASIVADTGMVAAGVTSAKVTALIGDPETARLARELGGTRASAAMHLAARRVGPGAIWVIGNAPTALEAVVDLAKEIRPTLVIGVPVGFVGAAESKARLRASGLPSVSNVSEKGGSAVAAAAVNALLYGDPLGGAEIAEREDQA